MLFVAVLILNLLATDLHMYRGKMRMHLIKYPMTTLRDLLYFPLASEVLRVLKLHPDFVALFILDIKNYSICSKPEATASFEAPNDCVVCVAKKKRKRTVRLRVRRKGIQKGAGTGRRRRNAKKKRWRFGKICRDEMKDTHFLSMLFVCAVWRHDSGASSDSNTDRFKYSTYERMGRLKCDACVFNLRQNAVYRPCNHLVLYCEGCYEKFKNSANGDLCPMCRTPIEEIQEIYFS